MVARTSWCLRGTNIFQRRTSQQDNGAKLFFPVSCPFLTWAILTLRNLLWLSDLICFRSFTKTLAIHSQQLNSFTFPLISHVSDEFAIISVLIIYQLISEVPLDFEIEISFLFPFSLRILYSFDHEILNIVV